VDVSTSSFQMQAVGKPIIGGKLTVISIGSWVGDWSIRGDVDIQDTSQVTGQAGKWFFEGGANQTV
jgi:hypothetical protein